MLICLHRHVEEARQRTSSATPTIPTLPLPVTVIVLDHFCPSETFAEIASDFLELVYPLLPLIHRPWFRSRLAQNWHVSSPSFLRLCLSIAAVTVASLPRKFVAYSQNTDFTSIASMVNRAVQLVQTSRVSSDVDHYANPTTELLTSSLMLSMASHYASLSNQGWVLANEAILFTRSMGLGEHQCYQGIPRSEAELRKRAFWVGYIIQMFALSAAQ
jgi:hypothetical protein